MSPGVATQPGHLTTHSVSQSIADPTIDVKSLTALPLLGQTNAAAGTQHAPSMPQLPISTAQQYGKSASINGLSDVSSQSFNSAAGHTALSRHHRQADVVANAQRCAYTPQELAEHLDQLKQEFRHIYSNLDSGGQQPLHADTTPVSTSGLS